MKDRSLTHTEIEINRMEGVPSAIVEEQSCWICQEEMSSEALVQHYKDHMRRVGDGS